MAEKRGNYEYRDDGTNAQLVTADVTIEESVGQLPIDHQATLVNTAVTHTSAVVANGAASTQATWQPVPEGMSEVITNLVIDAAVTSVWTNIHWSEDGTNSSGKTLYTVTNSVASQQKTTDVWRAVGGAFYKVEISNNDAAPHTCSANIKFRP